MSEMPEMPEQAPICPRCSATIVAAAAFCHHCGLDLSDLSALSIETLSARSRSRALDLMVLLREMVRRSPITVAPTVVFLLEALEKVLNSNLRTRPLGMALGLALKAARALASR